MAREHLLRQLAAAQEQNKGKKIVLKKNGEIEIEAEQFKTYGLKILTDETRRKLKRKHKQSSLFE